MSTGRERLAGLLPTTSMDIFSTGGKFHPQGLYSEEIFGQVGSRQRQMRPSYINLRTSIMHPFIYETLSKLKALYKGILSGTQFAIWDDESKDFIKSDIIDGQTGYTFFMEQFHDILYTSNDSTIRDLRISLLNKSHGSCIYDFLFTIPAGLRDIEIEQGSRTIEDDINKLYRQMLRASNTISIYLPNTNDSRYDNTKVTQQNTFNSIYDYIINILKGKKGFLLSKWASRNIINGTRNVLTAMDSAPKKLGSQEAITSNHTTCGLHQYLKATPDLSVYNIKNGPIANIIINLPNNIEVVDKNTLKRKDIIPSQIVKETWGTEKGIENSINKFEKTIGRDKPIYIDGDYAALIYRDKKYFRVLFDIDELPSHLSRSNVKPLTWVEMFYISVYSQSKKVANYVTRYPVTGTDSIYPSFIYLRTTLKVDVLQKLDNAWKPTEPNDLAICMPIIGEKYFESMSAHINKYAGLGADNDGDKTNLNCVVSKEAIEEAKNYLNSKEAYLEPDGSLRFGINNAISELVLFSLTCGLEEDE